MYIINTFLFGVSPFDIITSVQKCFFLIIPLQYKGGQSFTLSAAEATVPCSQQGSLSHKFSSFSFLYFLNFNLTMV